MGGVLNGVFHARFTWEEKNE